MIFTTWMQVLLAVPLYRISSAFWANKPIERMSISLETKMHRLMKKLPLAATAALHVFLWKVNLLLPSESDADWRSVNASSPDAY